MGVVTQAQQVLKSHGLGGLIVLTHGLSRDGLQRAEGGLAALRGPEKACGDEFAGGVIAAIIGKLAAGLFEDNVEVRCGPLVEICHGLGHCRGKELKMLGHKYLSRGGEFWRNRSRRPQHVLG